MVHDVTLVTPNNYPIVFKALELISHDCGRQAGHINYSVPLIYLRELSTYEFQLAGLAVMPNAEFDILCIGEEIESKEIVKKYGLNQLDNFLQRFFEEFQ